MKHLLKGFVAVVVLGGVLFWGWKRYEEFLTQGMRPSEATQKLNELEAKGIPQFTLQDLNGREVSLNAFKDQVVVVNFWASWCDPCITEFPSMIKLIEFFQGKVVLLAISADHEREDIDRFLKNFPEAKNPHIYIMWDKDQKVAADFGTEVLPESYILRKGLGLYRKVAGSEDWFSPGAVQLFQQLTHEGQDEDGARASD